jgi:methyl-accepting chemotaxis protein
MNSTMTISKRFIITSGILLLLSTAMATVAVMGFNTVGNGVRSLSTDTIPGVTYAYAMNVDISGIRGDQLRHILTDKPEELQTWEKSIQDRREQFTHDMKSYEETLGTGDGAERQEFMKLQTMIDAVDSSWGKAVPLSRAGKDAEAMKVYIDEVRPATQGLQNQLSSLVKMNREASDTTVAATVQAVQNCWRITLIVGIVSLIVGIVVSWLMVVALNKQLTHTIMELSEGAEQIAAAAHQVSSSSQSLAQGSSEQAAMIEETSSASAEINSMSRRTAESSQATAEIVMSSQKGFEKTNRSLVEMVGAMDGINASSQKISKIIKLIDEIAFQTNILALNAAVEAARAGEAGMGFAVVADEVRSLAQRSAQAAKDTAQLIEESIQNSDGGRIKVNQVAEGISSITAESAKIKGLIDEINVGSVEQSRGVEQISRAISQMEQVTQSSAANAEESAAAAEELNAQADAMKGIVDRLKDMVYGSGHAAGHAMKVQPRRSVGSAATYTAEQYG